MQARMADAARLIAQNDEFKLHAQKYHADVNANIDESTKLKAGATKLQQHAAALHTATPHLDPLKAKAAQNQFKLDLAQFKNHVDDYQAHLQHFQNTIGECHADNQEYALNLQQYSLHLEQFHMPGATTTSLIRPPHICKRLQMSMRDAQSTANSIMYDTIRMNQAQAQLQSAENKLNAEMADAAPLAAKAVNTSYRDAEESKLAGEFAHLRDEYKTLEIERQVLAGTGGKVTSTAVNAQIKH